MVLRLVLSPARAHVAVDRVQALGDRTRTIDVRLLGDDDLLVLPPETRFPGGSGAAQSCTDHEDVDAVFGDGLVGHISSTRLSSIWGRRPAGCADRRRPAGRTSVRCRGAGSCASPRGAVEPPRASGSPGPRAWW